MLMSANCNIQRCLSIFVFFRRRDQLINLFPNKMLTWGRQTLLTFAISLVRHTDAEVCEETTMTLLIYRHSLKKSANYTVYLTQRLKQIRQKKSFSCDSDVTGHGNRQRGTQRGEFYSLDKIFSTLCLCWCIHVAYESTFFSVMSHFPIYMGWTSMALNIKMDSDMPIGSRDPYPSTHGRERSGSVVECLTSLETEGPRVRASSVSLCCVFEQGTFILA